MGNTIAAVFSDGVFPLGVILCGSNFCLVAGDNHAGEISKKE